MRKKSEKKPRRLGKRLVFALVIVLGVGGYFFLQNREDRTPGNDNSVVLNQNIPESTPKKGTLKTFTGPQFRDLYNNFAYPNTRRINEDTPITGDQTADIHIRELAVKRGYMIRSAPVTDTFREVQPGMKLQERSAGPWQEMVSAAEKDGININLTAAYRSAEEQKEIFLSKLKLDGIYVPRITSGLYESDLDEVLKTTAVPGYSRHHTGYTIDMGCQNQPTAAFEYTVCFKWLSADNYKNAKSFGWIPSYPDGAGMQGPDPESWEYVWVGKDALTE